MAKTGYLALAMICAVSLIACRNRQESGQKGEPSPSRVTKEQITTWVDWADELQSQMLAGASEARQKMDDHDALLAMFERRRQEQLEILAREPLKGTPQGQAIASVVDTVYISGEFVRDEVQLDKWRAKYGKELVDSVLEHEAIIRAKLDPDGLHAWGRPARQ